MEHPSTHNLTREWQAIDARHHLQPFTDYKALHAKGARIITRAEGVYIWDSDGNRLLDGMAGLWCVNVGYGRRELLEAAQAQLAELPYYNTFFQCSHRPALELAELLAEVTPPGLNHVFYTNSGSEAADTVVRAVRRYWDVMGKPSRKVIIGRKNAYHGSTMAGASLGGMAYIHRQGGLPIPDIEHVAQPFWYVEGGDLSPGEFGLAAARTLERKVDELGPDRVAAFIAEPIQGAGGVVVPPDSYWPEIERICKERDILLVADEVICGFGRTGEWFGSDYYRLSPDLMMMAKGLSSGYLPIGGVMFADRVAGPLIESGGEFHHGFTYSGHPVCAAVALANVRILRDEGIVTRVGKDIGPYFQRRLRELRDHPLVGEVRGVGLIAGIQLVRDKARRLRFEKPAEVGLVCREHSIRSGLVMRAIEDSMVLSPPLVIAEHEVDELIDRARRSLDLTAAEVL
jgi:putrescine aminotransferase